MGDFIQLHILTSYAPSNLNRDDIGRPKTAVFGTSERLRVSSQSLKRAFRTSETFLSELGATEGLEKAQGKQIGIRTKDVGNFAYKSLTDAGVDEAKADEFSRQIASVFGKRKEKGKTPKELRQTEQLVFLSLGEKAAIDAFVAKVAKGAKVEKDELDGLLSSGVGTPDVALFGRMIADKPGKNIEAACQVAHALTVHNVRVEEDYYSAVDDLNKTDSGAGHLGRAEFGAGLFYLYICIDRTLLLDNLGGDEALTKKTLRAFIKAACKTSPTGKQNSFASREYAHFVLAEKGNQQPRSLSVSFLHPLEGKELLRDATGRLLGVRAAMETAYGPCAREHKIFEPLRLGEPEHKPELTFDQLIDFVTKAPGKS